MKRVFGHGGLRLYLLSLLDEGPKHGYELIRMVEDRFMGMYTPSAGTIYPRLAALEEDGLVAHDMVDGRKVYRLTDAGRAELDTKRDDIHDLQAEAVASARQLAHEIRDEVRASVRDFRRAMHDVKREERRMGRERAEDHRDRHHDRDRDRGRSREWQDDRQAFRSLRGDLQAFVADVASAARRHHLDESAVASVREVLLHAREAVSDVLYGRQGPGAE